MLHGAPWKRRSYDHHGEYECNVMYHAHFSYENSHENGLFVPPMGMMGFSWCTHGDDDILMVHHRASWGFMIVFLR